MTIPSTLDITLYTLIPAVFAIIGGILGSIYIPKPRLSSVIQHFVAGIVLSAVSVELLPKILKNKSALTVGTGFVIGVIVMLLIEGFSHHIKEKEQAKNKLPLGVIFAVAVDLFVDGLLIGVSFLAGVSSGIWIAISLSSCAFFVVLSTSSMLAQRKTPFQSRIICTIFLAIILPLGAFVGGSIVRNLPYSWFIETLAFGVAALLYLAIEELLVQAHKDQKGEPLWVTSTFFLGFLVILLFKM